jgi:polyisoprenyl-phosphate glycosyltransferase
MSMISIIIPAFNEEESLPFLFNSLLKQFENSKYNIEIIIIDDGSSDKTFEVVKSYNSQYSFIKGIRLSRNMGHQAALDCGLRHSIGDAVISMDADMQHPPEFIPKMLDLWENEGYEIVLTSKIENSDAGFFYRLWSKTFYYVFNKWSEIKLTPNGSDFRLMGRKSLDEILKMPEYHKFYRGLVHFVGFKTATIPLKVDKRVAGKRSYTFRKSLKLASDGVFSFSDFALKLPFFLGVIVLIVVIIYLIYVLTGMFLFDFQFVKGWPSTITLIIMSMGLQLVFIGTIGLYIGKIFNEVKRRPQYFKDEEIGIKKKIS